MGNLNMAKIAKQRIVKAYYVASNTSYIRVSTADLPKRADLEIVVLQNQRKRYKDDCDNAKS